MANISEYIAIIEAAARGEEVRDSICSALLAMNSDIPVQVEAALEAAKEAGTFDGTGIESIDFDSENYTLTINLDDGTSYTTGSIRGETGADGVSPGVTIETISGGHRITITDAEHPAGQSFDVLDSSGTAVAALANSFAGDFDDTTAYTAGDFVMKDDQLYRFTTDHAAGAWDGSEAAAVHLADIVGNLEGNVGDLADLTTTDQTNVVAAINEVKEEADDLSADVDDLKSDLNDIGLSVVNGRLCVTYNV